MDALIIKISTITWAVGLAGGIYLGVKLSVYFSQAFNNHKSHYGGSRGYKKEGHYEGEDASAFFKFLMLALVAIILFFVGKSAATKLGFIGEEYKVLKNSGTEESIKKLDQPIKKVYDIGEEPMSVPEYVYPKSKHKKTVSESQDNPSKASPDAFYVQAGAYSDPVNAQNNVTDLEKKGIHAFALPKKINEKVFMLVYAGPYSTIENAELVQKEIYQKGTKIVFAPDLPIAK
jgi:cell division protein FtsN